MLAGTDGFQLVEVHQQVIRQRHLLVELVREVEMIQIIAAKVRRQHPTHKRRLATTLRTDQGRHTLVSMQRVHLEPVGNRREEPSREERLLLAAHARQAAEETDDVVLSVPLGQVAEIILDGIEGRHLV